MLSDILGYIEKINYKTKNIFKTNFFYRLMTTFVLVLILAFVRMGNKLYVEVLFLTTFVAILWELYKNFKIPIGLLLIGKIAIIIELYFSGTGSYPNIFLHISLFRFLLMSKCNKKFFFYLSIFTILTLFFFSILSSLICLLLLVWDKFYKNSSKYVFSFFVINYILCGFVWLYYCLKPNGVIITGSVIMMLSCAINDICAYFAGSFIGGPKLAVKISKRKTISGLLGGIIGTYIIGYYVFIKMRPYDKFNIFTCSKIFPIPLFYLPFLATIGDLIQSYIKRYFKKKDAGNLLPGHGGLFDRLDSMFFVAIVYATLSQQKWIKGF